MLLILTQRYGREAVATEKTSTVTTRERFLKSKLIVPGIALKKFKQLETASKVTLHQCAGVMGTDHVQMYKVSKPRACNLSMGSVIADPAEFWNHAEIHCKNHPLGAIIMFDNFEGNVPEARMIKKHVYNIFV